MRLWCIYLSRAARENVQDGVDHETWGLTDEAVARSLNIDALGGRVPGADLLGEIAVGDRIVAASGGPQPRVERGGWSTATMREGRMWTVTKPYFVSQDLVWRPPARKPEERWPHRFGIEEDTVLTDVGASALGPDALDALHYSANVGGMPIPVFLPSIVTSVPPLPPGQTEDPLFLAIDGDLDATAVVKTRREQRALRTLLFSSTHHHCDLCGRRLPITCLRAAHIKKRSTCTTTERKDINNVMSACTLGCDHAFELSLVTVDENGVIRADGPAGADSDLGAFLTSLDGRPCAAHTEASAPYFAWHREKMSA